MMMALELALTLTSPDVTTGGTVPRSLVWNHDGCDGANRRPRLTWSRPPAGTHDFLLTVIDPDAPKPGGWVHWHVVLPATARSTSATPSRDDVEAENDFGTVGWGGPCPPPGQLHHYVFTLSARDAHGKVLDSATLIPVYRR